MLEKSMVYHHDWGVGEWSRGVITAIGPADAFYVNRDQYIGCECLYRTRRTGSHEVKGVRHSGRPFSMLLIDADISPIEENTAELLAYEAYDMADD